MTPIPPELLTAGIAIMVAGAVALHLLPGPCRCEKCGFHVNEARMAREAERERKHENSHRDYDTCGDKDCPRERERYKRRHGTLDS